MKGIHRWFLPLLAPGVLLLLLLLLPACASRPRVGVESAKASPRLVVISAFEPEMVKLRSQAAISATNIINGRSYYLGKLAGKDVVLVLSGMSMVNAAMTAQTALDHFRVHGIVLSGIAGGVNPSLHIGDVAVPAQWGEYQDQVFARETEKGWDTSPFPAELGNYGMMFPQKVAVTRRGGKPDKEEERFWFPVSPTMLAVAKQVAHAVSLTNRTPAGVDLGHQPLIVVGGNGVSGPTFVNNASYREWVWKTFHADALDMESAAVAHVAYVNAVPFIAFRSLSDLAGGSPGGNEVGTFFQLAADNSAAVVMAFLEVLQP